MNINNLWLNFIQFSWKKIYNYWLWNVFRKSATCYGENIKWQKITTFCFILFWEAQWFISLLYQFTFQPTLPFYSWKCAQRTVYPTTEIFEYIDIYQCPLYDNKEIDKARCPETNDWPAFIELVCRVLGSKFDIYVACYIQFSGIIMEGGAEKW